MPSLANTYIDGIASLVGMLIQQSAQGSRVLPQMSPLTVLCAFAGLCGVLPGLAQGITNATELPTVDLGYVLQKPTFLNTEYDV